LGTTCHVKGAPKIVDTLERELGIRTGETTKDMNFTLDTVNCIGCCGLAPVMTIGEDLYGKVAQVNIPRIIEKYRAVVVV
jgi:NADH:ubiquinone oxidoreductase subunit E